MRSQGAAVFKWSVTYLNMPAFLTAVTWEICAWRLQRSGNRSPRIGTWTPAGEGVVAAGGCPPGLPVKSQPGAHTCRTGSRFTGQSGGTGDPIDMRLLIPLTAVLYLLPFATNAQNGADQCHAVEMAERRVGGLEFGHIDNPLRAPIVGHDFWGRVVGQHDDTSLTGPSGVFRFEKLPPGVYFFVAVAQGFQSRLWLSCYRA